MENVKNNQIYDNSDEKELIKMWEDIKGTNIDSLNCSLMKAIAENVVVGEPVNEILAYSMRIWDSERGDWVPFDLWTAHYIINELKEYLALQIFCPASVQPQLDPTLWGWHSLDSSYLNEKLKEKENPLKKFNQLKSLSERKTFCKLIKQYHDEYRSEGRYYELPGSNTNRRA